MKKGVCIVVLALSCMNMAIAMEEDDKGSGWPFGSVIKWVGDRMDDADKFFEETFNLTPEEAEEEKESVAARFLLERLEKNSKLSLVFEEAIAQNNHSEFIMLVQGLKDAEIKTEKETGTAISGYLEVMQTQHSTEVKELLIKHMKHAAMLHKLQAQFTQDGGQQDNASFSDMRSFVRDLEKK